MIIYPRMVVPHGMLRTISYCTCCDSTDTEVVYKLIKREDQIMKKSSGNNIILRMFIYTLSIIFILGSFSFSISAAGMVESNVDVTRSSKPISGGTYYIQNFSTDRYITPNTGGLFNTSDHVEQWNYDYDKKQAWDIIYVSSGYYKIKNVVDGTYLTSPESTTSGQKITSEPVIGDQPERQLWSFTVQSDGTYQIKAKNRNSYVISSNTKNAINGGNIVQRPATDGDITKWRVIPWSSMHSNAMLNYGLPSRKVTILISGSTALNSTWKPIIQASVAAWNSSSACTNISLITSGTSDHIIVAEPRVETWYGLCNQTYIISTGETIGSTIILNTNTLTTDIAQSTAVHELGHLFSLNDNPSATNESIMCYSRNRQEMIVPQLYDIYNIRSKYN